MESGQARGSGQAIQIYGFAKTVVDIQFSRNDLFIYVRSDRHKDFTGTVLAAQGTNLVITHGTILVILQVAFYAHFRQTTQTKSLW